MKMSQLYKGHIVDQGVPKNEGEHMHRCDRNLGRKGGGVHSYSKAKCWLVRIKRGARLMIRRTETR